MTAPEFRWICFELFISGAAVGGSIVNFLYQLLAWRTMRAKYKADMAIVKYNEDMALLAARGAGREGQ